MAVVLKDIEGLSLAEIARALKLKTPTVKTRIHRGRLALRKELLGEPYGSAPALPAECLAALGRALEALDRGETLSLRNVCARCRNVYRTLALGSEACAALSGESLDPSARDRLLARLRDARAEKPSPASPGDHGR
jgi:hypothetical protein